MDVKNKLIFKDVQVKNFRTPELGKKCKLLGGKRFQGQVEYYAKKPPQISKVSAQISIIEMLMETKDVQDENGACGS